MCYTIVVVHARCDYGHILHARKYWRSCRAQAEENSATSEWENKCLRSRCDDLPAKDCLVVDGIPMNVDEGEVVSLNCRACYLIDNSDETKELYSEIDQLKTSLASMEQNILDKFAYVRKLQYELLSNQEVRDEYDWEVKALDALRLQVADYKSRLEEKTREVMGYIAVVIAQQEAIMMGHADNYFYDHMTHWFGNHLDEVERRTRRDYPRRFPPGILVSRELWR